MSAEYPPQSSEHAFATGLVMGCFMKAGIDVTIDLDDEGNYMTSMVVIVPGMTEARLVVLPPEEQA